MTWQVTWYEITHSNGTFGKEIGTSEFEELNFNHRWKSGIVFENRKEFIGFRATTRIIPLSNKLDITIGSDDGSRLFLDDKLVIDMWRLQGHRQKTAIIEAIQFKPSKLTYEWYEWGGYASAEFISDTAQMQAIMGVFPLNLPFVAQAIDIVALPFDAFSLAINPNAELPEQEEIFSKAAASKNEEIEIF